LDKLEAIPGFKTNLSTLEFKNIVSEIGLGIMGQTEKIAPADKKLYALRDVTATVESIPLITASILSKKFASGVDAIVFDVKVGNGAFMKDKKEAIFLAKHLVSISKNMKRKSVAVLTDMNEPLGEAVGNSLEVIEAINALKGRGPADLFEVTLALGAEMLVLGKRAKNLDEGKTELKRIWDSGKGLEKFKQMVERQRGNVSIIDDYSLFPQAKYQIEIKSWQSGFVKAIDTLRIGLAANELGAGRKKLDSVVDPAVGFLIKKKVGDKVEKGESLAIIFANNMDKGKNAGKEIEQSFKFSKTKVSKLRKILGRTNR
jgi:pyrimidine-nucleoside phosphorylase